MKFLARIEAILWRPCLAVTALFLLLDAFLLRWSLVTRPLWLDEYIHNFAVIRPIGFSQLIVELTKQFQPFLDYALRKYAWIPVLGFHEISLRVSSLFYSLVTVLITFAGSLFILRKEGWNRWWAVLATIGITAYTVHHAHEVFYSVEARHYSLVSLLSLCLAYYAFFLYPHYKNRMVLAGLALLAINTHFFFSVLLAPIFLMMAAEDLQQKNPRRLARLIGGSAVVFLVTVWVNLPAFESLLVSPPDVHATPPQLAEAFRRFKETVGSFIFEYAEFDFISVILIFLLCLVLRFSSVPYGAFLSCWLVFVPTFIFAMVRKSDHHIFLRYFSAFFGLMPSLYLLAFVQINRRSRHILQDWKRRPQWMGYPGVISLMGCILLLVWQVTHISSRWRSYSTLADIEIQKDFSSLHYIYKSAFLYERPLLVIRDSAYVAIELAFYWHFQRPEQPFPKDFFIVSTERSYCDSLRPLSLEKMKSIIFLITHTGAFPFFDPARAARRKKGTRSTLTGWTETHASVWKLAAPASLETIADAATSISLPFPSCHGVTQ